MYDKDYNPMEPWFIGKKIVSITLNKEADQIDFVFEGASKRLGVEGGCCSNSWIEHLTVPDDIAGAVIQSVDEPEMPPHDGHVCPPEVNYSRPCEHEVLAVYHTRFRTDRGDIVLEYRNDSNGYYGGNLVDLGDAD